MNEHASVLIVDDDPGMCETLSDVLRTKGHTVRTASTGREGLGALETDPVDVAIVDIKLPDIRGLALLEAIKRASPQTEVIFITGYASIATAIEAINGAAFAYMAKPFEMDHLVSTLRKAREKQALVRALRDSEERYRLVIENIHDAVFLFDLEGRCTFGNRRLEELTGYRLDELIGRSVLAVLTPEGAQEVTARWDAVRAGRDIPFFYETEIIRKDGTRILVEVSSTSVVENDTPVARLGVARDITERRRSEAALRESEGRFRAIFEQAAVGIAVANREGNWVRVNQRLCDMVGYSAEELQAMRFQDLTHPDDLPVSLHHRRTMFEEAGPAYSLEKRYLHKNGTIVWVNLTVSLAPGAAHEPDYSIAVIQDITERRQLEEELRHAQRMEGVGQLAGGIAHDFNNLLTVIGGRAQLGLDRLTASDPLRRDLDLIHKTADRAAMLTRQLLAFSRKQVLQPKVVDMNQQVRSSADLLKRVIGEDIELTFVSAPDFVRARVDPGQLEQVIVNLAVNARDAMPDGGRITIETANIELDADFAARHVDVTAGAYVMLAVSDTGLGMSPEVQARIFEPFFTTKGPGKGTGLGLATVYGIVKQSGGHIRVYSESGRGTAFKIYLPRTGDPLEQAAARAINAPPRGTETVLLVEDEAEVRRLAHEILERLGYIVLEASAPSDAMLIARQHVGMIDLLLTDVIMPRMSGRALAETIAAERPETKILFMSGYTDDAIVRHGVLEPGTHFIEKPFTREVFALKVRQVLDQPS